MSTIPTPEPVAVGGIRNFGWVEPGLVARGAQPPLQEATFEALRIRGIRAVLSLRPDQEPVPADVGHPEWTDYVVEDEHRLAERLGLRFSHLPLPDFAAPAPDEISAALAMLDAAVEAAPGVYVHCLAGAGRTALVTGAWMIAQGRSGDDAAATYQRFVEHTRRGLDLTSEEQRPLLRRIGQRRVWWALHQLAAALDSPITREFDLPPPERPEDAEGWEEGYRQALAPWRERRQRLLLNNGHG